MSYEKQQMCSWTLYKRDPTLKFAALDIQNDYKNDIAQCPTLIQISFNWYLFGHSLLGNDDCDAIPVHICYHVYVSFWYMFHS